MQSGKQISGIDGLKGLSALIIMWGHIAQPDFGHWNGKLWMPCLPQECVTLFGVITGFLAATSILARQNKFSLGDYYVRRARRICPLYYLYLCVVILLYILLGRGEDIINVRLWSYVFLSGEIPFSAGNGILPLVHLWYIGDIVLFYLLFPVVCKVAKRRLMVTCLLICTFSCCLKFGLYLCGGHNLAYRLVSVLRTDSFWLGSIVGILYSQKNKIMNTIANSKLFLIVSGTLFLLSGVYGSYVPAPIRIEFFSVIYALLVISITGNIPLKTKLLDNRIMVSLGNMSYGLYVIHPIVIILCSMVFLSLRLVCTNFLTSLCIIVMISLISVILAMLSSKFIENSFSRKTMTR